MPYQCIALGVSKGVARLLLNRPERLNALNEPMHAELRAALTEIAADRRVRCLLLSGAGRGFCAGADLAAFDESAAPVDLGAALERDYNPLVRQLIGLNIPVVAAINGVAAGAGANLALCADIVLAARSATFIQAFCKIGLIPDCAGTWVLPRLIGQARAMALALSGEAVSAERAEAMGMIWRAVDDEALHEQAEQLAQALAAGPTVGLAYTKRALWQSSSNTLDQQLDLERDLQRAAGNSGDHAEGVRAFLDKREPRFEGR